jgi:hypothetical protein
MRRIRRLLALAVAGAALLTAPGAAHAAIVTNGDFETGSFSGWQLHDAPVDPPSGTWNVYTGTSVGGDLFPAPPQGTHAAATDQSSPGRHLLYQDLTLPSGGSQYQLSMFVYYDSDAPISSQPNLDFNVIGMPNQQYRIDLIKPSAPIDSVASGDILSGLFQTVTGDPTTLAPTLRTADLSSFAGQTVRLRFAEVDDQGVFHAATDAVTVKTNAFTVGAAVRNKKKGTASVPVTVPDAGTIALSGRGVKGVAASKSVAVSGGGTVNLLVKAKGKTKRKLNANGKAKVKVSITYTPTGLAANTQQTKVKLKKKT